MINKIFLDGKLEIAIWKKKLIRKIFDILLGKSLLKEID